MVQVFAIIKGIVYPNLKILSSFTLPHVDPNLYVHKRLYFKSNIGPHRLSLYGMH